MSENNKNVHSLYSFAYCGTDQGFNNMLSYLAKIAEPEIWSFKSDPEGKLSILRYYFPHFHPVPSAGQDFVQLR